MPKGIRPTQDKVRKALFDVLGDVTGLTFLELFAGSGAVGLEAASRGAAAVVMIESNGECVRIIRENIEMLGERNAHVYLQDAEKAVGLMARTLKKFDIVFFDPPYVKTGASEPVSGRDAAFPAKKALQIMERCDILAPNGLVIIQHHKKDGLPDAAGGLKLRRQSRYGDTVLSFYGVE